MSVVLGTYSAKDIAAVINLQLSPSGPIQIAGVNSLGLNRMTVRMSQDRTTLKVGADGAVVVSAIAGDQGEIEVEVWQNSTLHQLFLAAFNATLSAFNGSDVSNWATGVITVKLLTDGSTHYATGVAFTKAPDKPYGQEAQTVNWVFRCADIQNN